MVRTMPPRRGTILGRSTTGIVAAVCLVTLAQPASAQFGGGRTLYAGRRGTTVVAPPPGPGPLDPLSVAAYWGFWPNPILARQPIGHQTIATSANGYIYRPVYADDATASNIALPNAQESVGRAPMAAAAARDALPEALMEAARVLFKAGRYEAAIDRLNRLLDQAPKEGEAYLLLTQAYFGLSNYEAATDALAAGLATAPEFTWEKYVADYSKYFASSLRFAMHLRTLERFVELHPERFEGHLLLGFQYGCLGKIDRALAELALARPNVEADKLIRHFAAAKDAPAPAPDEELNDEADQAPPAAPPKRRGRAF